MPNNIMFQIGKDMPTTKNELRDCCRNFMPHLVMKHQYALLQELQGKIENAKSKNVHIKFDEQPKQNAVLKPDVEMKLEEPIPILHQEIALEKGKLPEFKIKIKEENASSAIFGLSLTKHDITQKQGLQHKRLFEKLDNLSQLDVFKVLTGNQHIATNVTTKPKTQVPDIDDAKLQKILGKRRDRELKADRQEEKNMDSDENPVVKVVSEDFIAAPVEKKEAKREKESDELPKSLREQYKLKSNKKRHKTTTDNQTNPTPTEKQELPVEKPISKQETKDWSDIYGKATGKISEMMDQKAKDLQDDDLAKKRKKKKQQQKAKGGKNKEEKNPKYYLGSTASDFKSGRH